MKVIHIAGWSGSGKTTFILDLVSALAPFGKVGTIKHIGDHICDLPAGKDTSRHYDAGASIVTGIDLEKSMITHRTISLVAALDTLSDAGVEFAVVEGFKNIPFQKAVMGDLDVPSLIKNPRVEEIIQLLPSFDDYYTISGLVREIGEVPWGVISSITGNIQDTLSPALSKICSNLEDEIGRWEGVAGIRVKVQKAILHEHHRYFIIVITETGMIGITALNRCMAALQV
ncbi:MAG: molybdopterin-guanine dinucleotide biosynthesis protein B [Methanospirillum sp.]|uniref:molybdopterin-guanine dinucleotide biosynthesis protein B n=1 Tax=Methanospirillum sp. TaxID=45200 RepID=UPI0023705870|nr:molybdopterin-guanine dinucleotide biosynthesis protein B [Methanospirillum sp.]MDD1728166.1 molybdopterin-guanine dinucleotide biosynthesis protein B [Methanospirillum sp.]